MNTCDIDNPSKVLCSHPGKAYTGSVKGSAQVERYDLIPFVDRKIFNSPGMLHPGVIY